jgi:hypothetical protein
MRGSKEGEAKALERANDYGDELLAANWNPVLDLLAASCAHTAREIVRGASEELREEDAAAFLGRIYKLG